MKGPLSSRSRTLALALHLLLALGCSTGASWLVERPLERPEPPERTTIMMMKTPAIAFEDDGDLPEVVARSLQLELAARDIEATVAPLAGVARLPRIELVVRSVDFGSTEKILTPGSIVIDVAFVSGADRVTFVGRVKGSGHGPELHEGASAAGRAIAEQLVER